LSQSSSLFVLLSCFLWLPKLFPCCPLSPHLWITFFFLGSSFFFRNS
jgi:hypothetical protein